jgi:hypothetical protein
MYLLFCRRLQFLSTQNVKEHSYKDLSQIATPLSSVAAVVIATTLNPSPSVNRRN